MSSEEIRKKFLEFFASYGHAVVPSSSLIPDDPSVLLTTAGMQQFKKYYTGELNALADFKDNKGKPTLSTASVQKSFRTSDIDEVGDETHLTFFEMLGNFSFGGYWKEEAIRYAYEFITSPKWMGLEISYVTVFQGSDVVPKDEESKYIWKSLDPNLIIKEEGMEDVFWGPTGTSGPCGPTTEIYCKNAAGKDVEIWNIVFNEFLCSGSREELLSGTAKLTPLKTKGIDTGMGLERLAMIAQKKKNIFETDLFEPLITRIPDRYTGKDGIMQLQQQRVFADHVRAISFLISDGIQPSNKGAGYVLRRLMRRLMAYEEMYKISPDVFASLVAETVDRYGSFYNGLNNSLDTINTTTYEERKKFKETLGRGMKEMSKMPAVTSSDAFMLYQTYGMPFEVIKELDPHKSKNLTRADFDAEFKKHQELSRAGAEKKFGGHGLILDTGELKAANQEELNKVLQLHTSTHLLQQALREVLGPDVHQAGSDITPERTRFDFSFERKLTSEEIRKVEDLVNEKIKEDLPMQFKEMPKDEAEKIGALHFFKERYPDPVKVYFVGKDLKSAWSKEFCGGPHVTRTGEIGHFKIAKEEAVGAGVRRIRGIVE